MNEGHGLPRSTAARSEQLLSPAGGLRRRSAAVLGVLADIPPSLPALVLVLLLAVALVPAFFSPTNLQGLAPQIAALAVLTMGQTFVLLVRGLDLSVSAIAGASAVILSGRLLQTVPQRVGLAIAVAIVVGILNGFLVTKRHVPAFIATFGTLIFVGGAQLGVTQGQTSGTAPGWMVTIGGGRLGVIPWAVIIAAAVYLVLTILLSRTPYGRWIYATGSNPHAARYSGIGVDPVVISCYILCAVLAALAGLMMGGFVQYVDNTLGSDANLNSIAAAIIGGVAFSGGRGSLTGALAGAIVISVILNLLFLVGFDVQWRYILQGLILIAAVAVQRLQREAQ